MIQKQGTFQWQAISLPVDEAILVHDHGSSNGINKIKHTKFLQTQVQDFFLCVCVVLVDVVNSKTWQGDEDDYSQGFSPPLHPQALPDQGCKVTHITAGTAGWAAGGARRLPVGPAGPEGAVHSWPRHDWCLLQWGIAPAKKPWTCDTSRQILLQK